MISSIASSIASTFAIFFVALVGPAIAFGIYKIRRIRRDAERLEREALPYTPEPEVAPNAVLRRFPLGERAFLRQGAGAYRFNAIYLTWILFMLFIMPVSGVLPTSHTWHDLNALRWYRFVENASGSTMRMSAFICFISAFGAVSAIRVKTEAQFYRTRPVRLDVLFWGRVLPLVISLVVSVSVASIAAMAFVYLLYGPIWHHLPATFPGVVLPDDDIVERYAALLATSAPRIFLSCVTTFSMIFCCSIAVVSISFPRWIRPRSSPLLLIPVLVVLMLSVVVFNFAADMDWVHAPRFLFLYTRLGPPPPYAYALVPVAISTVALLLARRLATRIEI